MSNGEESVYRTFVDPPLEFRPYIYWHWNYKLEAGELTRQIKEFRDRGCGGFFIMPLILARTLTPHPPYLSKEWFKWVKYVVEEAERIGFTAWLYDEDTWPSGVAGGIVTEDYPEYRMPAFQLSRQEKVKGGETLEIIVPEGEELFSVRALPLHQGKPEGFPEKALNLTSQVMEGRLKWRAPEGEWLVLVFSQRVPEDAHFYGAYADTLNSDAMRYFIEVTHQAYINELGGSIGRVVPGIFTDEPRMAAQWGTDVRLIPWTSRFYEAFKAFKGYELGPYLPALFVDVGPITSKVRCDFYDVATELYVRAFFKQIYDYIDTYGMKLVGHVLCEGLLYPQVRYEGNFFRVTKYMHYAGIDFFEGTWPTKPGLFSGDNLCGPKFASSAAHLLEKPRVFSENFTVHGWKQDLRLMKRSTDWQIALGVNFFGHMAFFYSIQGHRKRGWPRACCNSTFWPHYKVYADHVGRLCSALSGGRHIADIAVLYPVKSIWAKMDPKPTPLVERIQSDFTYLTETLLRLHFDFDYIDEDLLQEADVSEGRIRLKGEEYRALILPPCTTISQKSLSKIKEFYERGGILLAIGLLPTESMEKGEDSVVAEAFQEIFGVDPHRILEDVLASLEKPVVLKRLEGKDGGLALFLESSRALCETRPMEIVEKALRERIVSDVLITSGGENAQDVIYLHRVKEGLHLYFFHNTSSDQAYNLEISLRGEGTPERWDSLTGEVMLLHQYKAVHGRTIFPLRLHPLESALIALKQPVSQKPHVTDTDLAIDGISVEGKKLKFLAHTNIGGKHYVEVTYLGKEYRWSGEIPPAPSIINLGENWRFKTEKPNALPLRDWSFRIETGPTQDNREVHRYETTFYADIQPPDARLLIDGYVGDQKIEEYGPYITVHQRVYFNDEEIKGFQTGRYLDPYILEADASKLIRPGENTIRVELSSSPLCDIPAMEGPPILIGSFKVSSRDGKPVLSQETDEVKIGNWVNQGYPYYSGTAIYEQVVDIPQEYVGKKLVLKIEGVEDMAEVLINDEYVKFLPWEPFECDVTSKVRAGRNIATIKVTNSLQNIIDIEARPSGILKKVEIVPYNIIEGEIPCKD